MRWMLLPSALALVAGCGSDPPQRFNAEDVVVTDSGLPPLGDRPNTTRDRTQPDVLDLTDVPPIDDMVTTDVPCIPNVGSTLTFGHDGGKVAFTDRFTLTAPLAFSAERRTGTMVTAMCATTIPTCSTMDMVDVGEFNAAFASRDVEVAFGMARAMPILYGSDPRPADGQVFVIERDGARVLVGATCRAGGMTGCLEIPLGLQHLVDVLIGLRDQELLRTACMAFRRS